jgi:hypothetical protein
MKKPLERAFPVVSSPPFQLWEDDGEGRIAGQNVQNLLLGAPGVNHQGQPQGLRKADLPLEPVELEFPGKRSR